MTRNFAKFILALFTFFASLCLHAGIYEFFFPWLGAEAKICLRVVDDLGKPVEGAKVTGYFHFTEAMKTRTVRVTTDADGCAELKENCDNTVAIEITKDGYYQSEEAIDYGKPGHALKGGKWFPYGELKTYVLNRIQNPTAMYDFLDSHFDVPQVDIEYGFDLEYGDFVKPYGEGEVADFNVMFTWSEDEHRAVKTMTIRFLNPMDGAYAVPLCKESRLKSPHRAKPEAAYEKMLAYQCVWEKKNGKYVKVVQESYRPDQCLIIRTRSVVDAQGTLVRARYGKIYNAFDLSSSRYPTGIANRFVTFLNPTDNDTNLEFDGDLHLELQKGNIRMSYGIGL